jgi:hypothetical protein
MLKNMEVNWKELEIMEALISTDLRKDILNRNNSPCLSARSVG